MLVQASQADPVGGLADASLPRQSLEQRCSRRGVQHPDQSDRDPRRVQELCLLLEDLEIVVVETHDHPRPDHEPRALDHLDTPEQISAQILALPALAKAQLSRRLDADEDACEAGAHHQVEDVLVLREVERGL